MQSPEVTPDTDKQPTQPYAWKPYQRSGVLGVDYDDYGAEMAPNARVWKKYVEEADRMDKELVVGWNKTLDIILIFAALFSAISTAFLLESSKDLKPDYTENSAQTLLLVSQTLLAISQGTTLNVSTGADLGQSEFTPSSSSIVVNTLWFLSLSLSVAVSLIAMLAKDWCDSFMNGRVGSTLKQGRLRQQRWDAIARWKLKEILNVLPLLMHTALLLFAVGLSLYLWDINVRVAMPVVVTTSLAGLFYFISGLLPLFFPFCPFTTCLVRFLHPYWMAILGNYRTMDLVGTLVASLAWISHGLANLKRWIIPGLACASAPTSDAGDLEATNGNHLDTPRFDFRGKKTNAQDQMIEWIASMRGVYTTDRSQLVEGETKMDQVTSSMIAWMISNCENPKAVDMALQALAGAEAWLPRRPLWESGAMLLLCERVRASVQPLRYYFSNSVKSTLSQFLDEASLFSRSLYFLTTFVGGEGVSVQKKESPRLIYGGGANQTHNLDSEARIAYSCIAFLSGIILDSSWASLPPRYEIAAYEASVILIETSKDVWDDINQYHQRVPKQWNLVRLIATGEVPQLPLDATLAMIDGITKTYFYEPTQSLVPLVELLNTITDSTAPNYDRLRYAIGVGLTVAAFATGNYPGGCRTGDVDSTQGTHIKMARRAYDIFARKPAKTLSSGPLLAFGLLNLLTQKTEGDWSLSVAEVKTVGKGLERLFLTSHKSGSYHAVLPIIPLSFSHGQHFSQVVSECLRAFAHESACNSACDSPALARLDAILAPSLCATHGNLVIAMLIDHFTQTDSLALKRLCLRGIEHSAWEWNESRGEVFSQILRDNFLGQLLETTVSTDYVLVPEIMCFLWDASRTLVNLISKQDDPNHSVFVSVLQSLYNGFTPDLVEGALPTSLSDLGLPDLWLPKLTQICESHPESVLSSQVLDAMIQFYEHEKFAYELPRTTKLASPFDSTWTWIKILQELKSSCERGVEQHDDHTEVLRSGIRSDSIATIRNETQPGRSKDPQSNLYWAM